MVELVRLLLAVAFVAAAVSKLVSLDAFARYLATPLGRFSRVAALIVIFAEAALGASTAVWASSAVYVAGMTFVVVATSFLAVRMVLARETRCNCWGSLSSLVASDATRSDLYRPALYALRNGLLAIGLYVLYVDTLWEINSVVVLGLLGATSSLIAVGLLGAIVRETQALRRGEHPLERIYEIGRAHV